MGARILTVLFVGTLINSSAEFFVSRISFCDLGEGLPPAILRPSLRHPTNDKSRVNFPLAAILCLPPLLEPSAAVRSSHSYRTTTAFHKAHAMSIPLPS